MRPPPWAQMQMAGQEGPRGVGDRRCSGITSAASLSNIAERACRQCSVAVVLHHMRLIKLMLVLMLIVLIYI
jgi:hypothetical protein